MTTDYQEAQSMVAEAEEAGVCLVVAQNYSFMQHNQTVKAILSDPSSPYHPGEIGMADIHCYRYRPDPRTMTFPSAMVWDMACHHIDILTNWFGVAPEVLSSQTFNPRWSAYPHDSNIAAHLKIGDDVYCNYLLYHSSILHEARILLQGDRGVLEIDPAREVWFHPKPECQLFPSERVKVPLLEGYSVGGTSEVMDAFWHYIAEGVEPTISGRANLATLQTCHQLIEASGPKLAVA